MADKTREIRRRGVAHPEPMKRRRHLVLLTVLLLLLPLPAAFGETELTDSEIAKILEYRIKYSKGGVGLVAGIIDEHGTRIISYGKPGKDSTQTVNGDSVFEIGSISKVFTATLLADMIERGEMRLDDPLAKYLPPSVKVPKRNGREITLKDLATHSSSLPRMPGNFVPTGVMVKSFLCPFCKFDGVVADLWARYSFEDTYEALSDLRLKRDIGSLFEYSNWGVALLGNVLSLRTGTDYEALLKARITEPLQMHDTAVKLTPRMSEHLAHGHDQNGKPQPNWDMPTFAGAGGIRSTANDLLKFVAVHLGFKDAPISKAALRTHDRQYECCNGEHDVEIGLGWFLEPQFEGTIITHTGGTAGYVTFMAFDRAKRKGVIVLSNSVLFIDDIGHHLLDNIQYPLADNPKKRTAIPADPKLLPAYAGKYRLPSGETLTITAEGERLFATRDGKKKVEIFAQNARDFFWKVPDAKASFKNSDVRATFVRNDKSDVTHLVLHVPGRHAPAPRIE
jgi:serine-type D-Ala-D-Ala carboxypeptidase/endopeptidase